MKAIAKNKKNISPKYFHLHFANKQKTKTHFFFSTYFGNGAEFDFNKCLHKYEYQMERKTSQEFNKNPE